MNIYNKIVIITISTILVTILYIKKLGFYYNIKQIDDPNQITVLVNKNNILNKNYIPNDLEQINTKYALDKKFLRKEAKINFEKMSSDASKLGYKITAVSAYRDYYYQKNLFEKYIKEKGIKYALDCCAKPGHSEHQTGLAVDIMTSTKDYHTIEQSNEFFWLKNNAHLYGFILRYPKNKTYITKFKYEPWHFRYVGKNVATKIYENNITLEEYYKTLK